MAALATAEPISLDAVRLQAPIPRPPLIRDCLSYLDHVRNCQAAMGKGRELNPVWFEIPAFYFGATSTVVGPEDDVTIAPGCAWFDVELEIAAVIGTPGRDIAPQGAQRHIAGYTIYADWSARDLQARENVLGIGQGKSKDCATTLGPFLVTPDDLPTGPEGHLLSLDVSFAVNGERVGQGQTDTADWSFAELISYASRGVDLQPGDVFGSGTVPTCCLLEHFDLSDPASFRGWLTAGDVVTLSVTGLGSLDQTVRAGRRPAALRPRPDSSRLTRARRANPARAKTPYTRGLQEIGPQVWAWTLPDGGYGMSNAGLIAGEGGSVLVDTLFDLHLTGEMLAAMSSITKRHPLTHAVLTHSNGDHTFGTELLSPEVSIITAEATAHEMRHEEATPSTMVATQALDFGPVTSPFLRQRFGCFDFHDVSPRQPDQLFQGHLILDAGGRSIEIRDLGPAHTAADSVVHIPDAGVLFAGDLLFLGTTPIVWSGLISNSIGACDTMLGYDADSVVPGHGPITDSDGSAPSVRISASCSNRPTMPSPRA